MKYNRKVSPISLARFKAKRGILLISLLGMGVSTSALAQADSGRVVEW